MADTTNPWDGVASSLLTATKATVESSAKGFLASHLEAEQFIVRCTEQLAKAMFMKTFSAGGDYEAQIDALKVALKEEAYSIVIDFEKDAPGVFMAILETIFNVGKTLAPLVFKAVV